MKALFVNGSPRKNWNTFKMLESAMKGAADSGAECEFVNLYDAAFKGCVSCFACKLKNDKTNGLCAFKDALTPVLEKARQADMIVIGGPVYFSHVTAMTLAFTERLLFPLMNYDMNNRTKLNKIIPTAMIFTMNCPEDLAEKINYNKTLGSNVEALKTVFGYSEMLCAYDTYQFSDYSCYYCTMFDEAAKAKQRDTQFPIDLNNAYELGKRLAAKVSELN